MATGSAKAEEEKKRADGIVSMHPVIVSVSAVMQRRVMLIRHVFPQKKPSNLVKRGEQTVKENGLPVKAGDKAKGESKKDKNQW